MKKYKEYSQGEYTPIHRNKYKGVFPITYRSSWELSLFKWCDHNKNVLEWGSESIIIPYLNPTKPKIDGTPKLCRYYPDMNVKIKGKDNVVRNFLIEVKPYRQTLPPKTTNRKNKDTLLKEQLTYAQNQAKWEAAKQWATSHGYTFTILTEKDIFNNK